MSKPLEVGDPVTVVVSAPAGAAPRRFATVVTRAEGGRIAVGSSAAWYDAETLREQAGGRQATTRLER